jgi:hypothetical protein
MNNYKFIVNPRTGRKVRIDGRIGRRVLKQYFNQNGGQNGYANIDQGFIDGFFAYAREAREARILINIEVELAPDMGVGADIGLEKTLEDDRWHALGNRVDHIDGRRVSIQNVNYDTVYRIVEVIPGGDIIFRKFIVNDEPGDTYSIDYV